MRKFEVVYHYSKDDPEFYGDYREVDIMEVDTVIKTYGDYYHDKGAYKIEGFLDALIFMGMEFTVIRSNIADWDY